jgi:DNA primase
MRLKVLQLAGGLDPDEYVQKNGVDAYRQALVQARPFFHWLTDRAAEQHDARTPQGKAAALKSLLKYIHMMPDRIDRSAVADDTAARIGIDRGLVLDEFRKAATERREARDRSKEEPPLDANERILIYALLSRGDLALYAAGKLMEAGGIERFRSRRIIEAAQRIVEGGAMPTVDSLGARLVPEDLEMLHRMTLEDDPYSGDVSQEQVDQVLTRLRTTAMKARLQELARAASEAEKAGDVQQALRLMEERVKIEKEMKRPRE